MQSINDLINKATEEEKNNRYPGADALINGHLVEVRIVLQCRRTTFSRSKQKPSVMFKVNGKRMNKSDFMAFYHDAIKA